MNAVRFYFRHFYSVNKRLLKLIFRKNRLVTLNIKTHLADISVKRSGSPFSLIISTENAFVFTINGLPIPVLDDQQPISIHYPLEKGKNKLTFCAKGIGSKKRLTMVVENDLPSISPIPFNKQLLVKEPNRRLPSMAVRLKEPTIRRTVPAIKLKLPMMKKTVYSLNQSLEEDLLNFLANNQNKHE